MSHAHIMTLSQWALRCHCELCLVRNFSNLTYALRAALLVEFIDYLFENYDIPQSKPIVYQGLPAENDAYKTIYSLNSKTLRFAAMQAFKLFSSNLDLNNRGSIRQISTDKVCNTSSSEAIALSNYDNSFYILLMDFKP